MLVALNAGHGGKDPGAVGKGGLKESQVNLAVARHAYALLKRTKHKAFLVRDSDVFIPVAQRADMANARGADLFVSIHCNANEDRRANGTDTFYYHVNSKKPAQIMLEALVQGLGLRDRGVKQSSYVVLRRTKMPAVLAELAFISNVNEEKLLADPVFQHKAGEAIVEGVVRIGN